MYGNMWNVGDLTILYQVQSFSLASPCVSGLSGSVNLKPLEMRWLWPISCYYLAVCPGEPRKINKIVEQNSIYWAEAAHLLNTSQT
jgi:hypothetical protein